MERLNMNQWNRLKTGGAAITLGICIGATMAQPTVARSEGDDEMSRPPRPNPTEHKFGGPTGQQFGGREQGGPGGGPGGPGHGPRPDGPPPRPEEGLAEELDLTDAQQKKVQAIFEKEREQMRAIHEKTRSSIMELLTAEQKKKFAEMPQPGPLGRGPRGGRPGGPGGPPRGGPRPGGPDEEGFRPMNGDMQDEDHGRPVALIARDLGVTPEQFRAAFKKVTPAPRGQRPTEAQRIANRKALSTALGVSPEKLDEVMDRYRPEGPNGPPRPE